jgi:hypothetical protein
MAVLQDIFNNNGTEDNCLKQNRTKRICIICLLATFLSGITQSAAGFSFGVSNTPRNESRTTSNRPWGNLGTPKAAKKYQPPPALPSNQYLGATPGAGWYAAQLPGIANPVQGTQPVVEVETSERVLYEQQNIIYTVRVVSSDNLKTLNPSIPRAEGAVIEQVDGPVASTRSSGQNGSREIVNEYRFKLTPLRPGDIVIPAIHFTGTHVTGRQWQGAPGMPAGDPGSAFSIASDKALELKVLPADSAVTPWLPLHDLRLRTHMADNGPVKAGIPVSLTLELTARGALGSQLPSLESQLKSNNFRAYRDSVATSSGISKDGRQLLGTRKETYTIIPQQDGWIRLPAIQVAWWDVDTDTAMLAGLPGQNAAAGSAGDQNAAMASGEQALFPTYFWASMFILLGLIAGYWLGTWARTRPFLHKAGVRFGNWLSSKSGQVLQQAATVGRKYSPVPYLGKARMGLALVMPKTVKMWMCLRCIEREDNPGVWCDRFRSRICKQLDLPGHAPMTAITEKIIETQPRVNPAALRSLTQSMDNAVYGTGSLDFSAWKKDFRYQLRPRLFSRRHTRARRRGHALPELNPHAM